MIGSYNVLNKKRINHLPEKATIIDQFCLQRSSKQLTPGTNSSKDAPSLAHDCYDNSHLKPTNDQHQVVETYEEEFPGNVAKVETCSSSSRKVDVTIVIIKFVFALTPTKTHPPLKTQ